MTSRQQQQQQQPNRDMSRVAMIASLHRSMDMVRRIREVQELSQSPALVSSFAPSIVSTKPRKHKAEFHYRANRLGPPSADLADLSTVHGGVGTTTTTSRPASSAAAPSPSSPPSRVQQGPTAATTTPTKMQQQQPDALQQQQHRSPSTTTTMAASSADPGTPMSPMSEKMMRQQHFDQLIHNRCNSPYAERIFSGSRAVKTFTDELEHHRSALFKQVKQPQTAVFQEDKRDASFTRQQHSRATFLKGVLMSSSGAKNRAGSAGGGGGGGGAAAAASDGAEGVNIAGVGRCPSPEQAARANLFASQQHDQPGETCQLHVSPRMQRYIHTDEGAGRKFSGPSPIAPTDLTRKSCTTLCSYRQMQAAARKLGKTLNASDFVTMEGSMNSSNSNSGSGGGDATMMMMSASQTTEGGLPASFREMQQRRSVLIRGGASTPGGGNTKAASSSSASSPMARSVRR